MESERPFPSLFAAPPAEWHEVAAMPVGSALKVRPGRWLFKASEMTIREMVAYGTQFDITEGDPSGKINSIWCHYLTSFLYVAADKQLPAEMAQELVDMLRKNTETFVTEAQAANARNGSWAEFGPCEACADKKNYLQLFSDVNLYRCRHCGRWAELVVETDRDMRRHRSDFDWERALPLIDGDKWMKPLALETATEIIREKKLGQKSSVLASRRYFQEVAERSFRLPWPIAIADVLPLAEQLFAKLGLPFAPEKTQLEDGTHSHEDKSGLKVSWANVTPDDFGFDSALGGGLYNQFARIEMPPCSIAFRIFASRLDAFDMAGPIAEVRRIAAEIKAICT